MKFIHIADCHLDAKFDNLIGKENLSQKRRIEQREVFTKAIEYAKNNDIDYIFISGDLYEEGLINLSTIEYINDLFKAIPNIKIIITPGNHDPYIKQSVYDTYNFSDNVYVFDKYEVIKKEYDDVNIYGFAFNSFFEESINFEGIELDKSKLNILVMHGDLNASQEQEHKFNPVQERLLQELGFDYIAMGHIHKNNYDEGKTILYPGSLASLGFDEPDLHGMIVGEFSGKSLSTKFVPLDTREFKQLELDVKNVLDENDLIYKINELVQNDIEKTKQELEKSVSYTSFNYDFSYLDISKYIVMYEVYLVGNRTFDIDLKRINILIDNDNIIKIKDKTEMGFDLKKISKESTLRGLFVKKVLEKQDDYSKEEIDKALEIGLNLMK
jgi:DNA repair exonuclease SbcCD nuclease subunit